MIPAAKQRKSKTVNEACVSLQFHNDSSGPGIRQANSSFPYFWKVYEADGQCIVPRKDSLWMEWHFHLHHVILKPWTTEKCGLTRLKATSCCRCHGGAGDALPNIKLDGSLGDHGLGNFFCKSARHRVYGVVKSVRGARVKGFSGWGDATKLKYRESTFNLSLTATALMELLNLR